MVSLPMNDQVLESLSVVNPTYLRTLFMNQESKGDRRT